MEIEGWTRWPTDVPSNPYYSVILWFCNGDHFNLFKVRGTKANISWARFLSELAFLAGNSQLRSELTQLGTLNPCHPGSCSLNWVETVIFTQRSGLGSAGLATPHKSGMRAALELWVGSCWAPHFLCFPLETESSAKKFGFFQYVLLWAWPRVI